MNLEYICEQMVRILHGNITCISKSGAIKACYGDRRSTILYLQIRNFYLLFIIVKKKITQIFSMRRIRFFMLLFH